MVKTWSASKGGKGEKKAGLVAHLRSVCTTRMLLAWLAWALLLWWVLACLGCLAAAPLQCTAANRSPAPRPLTPACCLLRVCLLARSA